MFYELEDEFYKYPPAWYCDGFDPFITVKCPKYPEHQYGDRDFNVNLRVELKGKRVPDFVSTWYSDWLITDKVAEIFSEAKLTGYELHPVKVCNRDLAFNLWEMIITGSAGKAHPDAGISLVRHCEYCGSTRYTPIKKGVGIIVNEETWDGSDFFTTEEYYKYVLVTEKVKRIIEGSKLTGVKLVLPSTLGQE